MDSQGLAAFGFIDILFPWLLRGVCVALSATDFGSAKDNIPKTRERIMGTTHVTVTIRNPALPDKSWEGLFLVDTGAIDSLVPREHLESIGLKPKAQRIYELADGSEVKMDITTADIEFMGDLVGGTIIFGKTGVEPILGVTALESVGIEIDPQNQRLKRMPATRLKPIKKKA